MARYATKDSSERRALLLWAIVEIVAFSFSADLQRLKLATLKTGPERPKILPVDDISSAWNELGRPLIAKICSLVRTVDNKMTQNRWLLIHPRDKGLVKKLVLEPVEELGLGLDFVLEILGRFHRGWRYARPGSTLLIH
ncbi:hypothetical protein PSPO01_07825 [Paraphaeosphaeria sporulosa]